ncbi:MAG: DNA polymerase III subunit beta [Deltaproteobacteria bacterium]|nr:DNA polymerase III subunit beta [Deltaproteobacteria bacterium]MBV8451768.1 DNA polymerase III subunit beta [Deltaproteobacteria bacterium]
MELAIDRVSLLNSLSMVQGIVERRNTVPILGHVLIEPGEGMLRLVATDLEVGIRTEIAAEMVQPGPLTLSARKLFEIVRETEGEKVTIKALDNDWFELRCGRAKFKMTGLDPRSFPAMPSPNGKDDEQQHSAAKCELKLPAAEMAAMIDKTIFAVSPDEARYNLSGVYIVAPEDGTVRMVATDGHRLSMIDRAAAGFSTERGVIIPRKGLAELRKLLDQASDNEAQLVVDGQLAWLRRGATELSMRLVEGEFPDYKGVIPGQARYEIHVGRDALLNAMRRAAIFSNERYHGVKLAFAEGTLTVSSTSPDLGEASETLDVAFHGTEFSIGFNALYIQQVLNVIPSDSEAILGLSDEVTAGIITTPSDSEYQYIVMPMRL